MKISVSYLSSIYPKKDTIKLIDESSADMIHVDLIDGIYVGDKSNFTVDEVIDDLSNTHKPLDIHLMVREPISIIDRLSILSNIDTITIHIDSTSNIDNTISRINSYGYKVGIAINPRDNLSIIDRYLNNIDYILIMSVYPGKGGQSFIISTIDTLKYYKDKDILIGIDGGINNISIKYLSNYRIDNLVVGSYICKSNNFNERIDILRNEFGNVSG